MLAADSPEKRTRHHFFTQPFDRSALEIYSHLIINLMLTPPVLYSPASPLFPSLGHPPRGLSHSPSSLIREAWKTWGVIMMEVCTSPTVNLAPSGFLSDNDALPHNFCLKEDLGGTCDWWFGAARGCHWSAPYPVFCQPNTNCVVPLLSTASLPQHLALAIHPYLGQTIQRTMIGHACDVDIAAEIVQELHFEGS